MTRTLAALLTLCLAAALAAAPAVAQDGLLSGTLAAVRSRGTILIGTREGILPFSFVNRGGQPIGFSVDLCHAVATDVAAALGLDLVEPEAPAWQRGVRIQYVPVAAEARLSMLVAGTIDLECGSTTANAERSKVIAFSPVFFLAGTKLLVPAGSAASYRDLAGKVVAVSAGTTNAVVLKRLAGMVTPPISVMEMPSVALGYEALADGRAAALASDDILLTGVALAHADGARFRVVGDYLSYEPYAIGLRRDDAAFSDLVQRSFSGLAESGALRTLYNRWFLERLPTGPAMGLAMSAQLAEMYRGLGQAD